MTRTEPVRTPKPKQAAAPAKAKAATAAPLTHPHSPIHCACRQEPAEPQVVLRNFVPAGLLDLDREDGQPPRSLASFQRKGSPGYLGIGEHPAGWTIAGAFSRLGRYRRGAIRRFYSLLRRSGFPYQEGRWLVLASRAGLERPHEITTAITGLMTAGLIVMRHDGRRWLLWPIDGPTGGARIAKMGASLEELKAKRRAQKAKAAMKAQSCVCKERRP